MTHRRRVVLACSLLFLGFVALSPMLRAFGLNTGTGEQDLRVIFQTIAIAGKFNVVMDPKVRTKMSVRLENVDPLEALYVCANLNNLKVKKLADVKGKLTYAVAPQDVIERGFEQGFTKTRRLRYAKAEDVATILSKGLGKEANVQVERDSRTNSVIMRGTEEILGKLEDLIKDLDLPVPQVVIDAKVVTVQTTFTRNLGFVWNLGVGGTADGNVNEKTAGSGAIFAITEYQKFHDNQSFYNSPSSSKGSGLFQFGDFFRGNLFINSSFAALEANGITRTLSSPRLLAINGAQAQLRIGDKIVFSGGPSQPPEERDTGTVMDITPRINRDNFITMDINVEQSSARFDRGDFPTITRTNAKTTVQVKDGEEVLVGGLVQENSSPNSISVPFLGEIPLIKHFFQRKNNQNTSLELVILLTPRVVKQDVPGDPGEAPVASTGTAPGPIGPAPSGDGISDLNDILDSRRPRAPDVAPAGPGRSGPGTEGAPAPVGPPPGPGGGGGLSELGL